VRLSNLSTLKSYTGEVISERAGREAEPVASGRAGTRTAGTGSAPTEPVRDRADVLVDLLCQEASDVDAPTKKLGIRLMRLANHLERELRRELAAEGIEAWELEVLLALHRAPGRQMSAGALLRESQVTAGAITNRVARLEAQGWVRRDVDPADRRQVLVTLTPAGERHAEKIIGIKTTAEQRLFGQADPAAIERMSEDLRNLLLAIEGPAQDAHPYERCPDHT
jgi:DNA-binding MarR family transcriptional regulator